MPPSHLHCCKWAVWRPQSIPSTENTDSVQSAQSTNEPIKTSAGFGSGDEAKGGGGSDPVHMGSLPTAVKGQTAGCWHWWGQWKNWNGGGPTVAVTQEEQHVFSLTNYFKLPVGFSSVIKLQSRQSLSSSFTYQYPSLSSCCHLILWHDSFATHSCPQMAIRSPLPRDSLVIMMSLFCDSMQSACVCIDSDPTATITAFLYVLLQPTRS